MNIFVGSINCPFRWTGQTYWRSVSLDSNWDRLSSPPRWRMCWSLPLKALRFSGAEHFLLPRHFGIAFLSSEWIPMPQASTSRREQASYTHWSAQWTPDGLSPKLRSKRPHIDKLALSKCSHCPFPRRCPHCEFTGLRYRTNRIRKQDDRCLWSLLRSNW